MSKHKPSSYPKLFAPHRNPRYDSRLVMAVAEWQAKAAALRVLAKAGYNIKRVVENPDEPLPSKPRQSPARHNQVIPGVPRDLMERAVRAARYANLGAGAPDPMPDLPKEDTARKSPNAPITTMGHLPELAPAYVYVGVRRDGRVKIGMSTEPGVRAERQGFRLHMAHPVTTAAAKAVETEALRLLGQKKGDGEALYCEPKKAVEAVHRARDIVARSVHADPDLTPEQARLWRVAQRSDDAP